MSGAQAQNDAVRDAPKTMSDRLAMHLRGRIVAGEFAPGRRLPTFQEMEAEFGASRKVVQLAVARLKDDGFLRPQTERGVFVSDHPPHLRRYGLVFPVGYSSPEWSRFDDALIRQSQDVEKQSVIREFDVFAGAGEHGEGPAVMERLRSECRRDRLAGLILMPGTHELAEHYPFDSETLPKVFVFSPADSTHRPIVGANGDAMIARGLEWLAQRGRRRVAVLRVSDYGAHWNWREHYERAGLAFDPKWIQAVGRCDPSVVQTLIPLMLGYPGEQRPDGLLVADDNLVDYAAAALAKEGVRLGEDFDMVAHCNWPGPGPKLLPMRRIGFHAGQLLDRCIQTVDAQRRGESPPAIQQLSPLFEDEVEPAQVGRFPNA